MTKTVVKHWRTQVQWHVDKCLSSRGTISKQKTLHKSTLGSNYTAALEKFENAAFWLHYHETYNMLESLTWKASKIKCTTPDTKNH